MNKKISLLVVALLVAGQWLVAQVDPAELNLGPNLLVNPSFDEPDDGTTTLEGWTILDTDWLCAYYGITNTIGANNGRYGPEIDDSFFYGGNGSFFADYIDGGYVYRTTANNAGGAYQVISGLTPGEEYFVSINAGFRRGSNVQYIREDESLKIVKNIDITPDNELTKEDVLIYEVPLAVINDLEKEVQEEILMDQWGTFTVPEGVTEVRFLFDKRNGAGGLDDLPVNPLTGNKFAQSGLYMWDNCKFQKVFNGTGIRTITGNDPVVSTRYYTVEGVDIANPPAENGIYIVRKTLQSGKVVVEKKILNYEL